MDSSSDEEKGSPEQHVEAAEVRHRPSLGGRPLSVVLTGEQFKAFELMYLTPGAAATKSSLRKSLGNPTALGVASIILILFPLSINWLQWGTNSRDGIITLVGSLYFVSGVGLEIAGILEWILGNTFIFLIFCTLGGFTFSLGVAYDPTFNIAAAAIRVPAGVSDPVAEAAELLKAYDSGLGIWLLTWSFLSAIYFIGCLRVNVVLSASFFNVTLMFLMIGLSNYYAAYMEPSTSSKLVTAAGFFGLFASLCDWYLLMGFVLQAVGGNSLPTGDLQRFWTKKND